MPTDIKLSKAQISKIIQSGGFLWGMLGSLGKALGKEILTKDILPGLVSSLASNGGKVKHVLRVTSYEFKSMSYEFKSTSYEFKSTSNEFKSTSSRIIKLMKT